MYWVAEGIGGSLLHVAGRPISQFSENKGGDHWLGFGSMGLGVLEGGMLETRERGFVSCRSDTTEVAPLAFEGLWRRNLWEMYD